MIIIMKVIQISVLLTVLAIVIADELTNELQDTKDNSTKLILKKSEPYSKSTEETTFFSKLKNWIFPGNNVTPVPDSKAVAGRHAIPLYVAPPRPIHPNRPDCDPCNKEPWIPIATNYGQSTLIGFVPQSAVNSLSGITYQQYGVPQLPHETYGVPFKEYGVPQLPQENYGPPPQHFIPPKPVENLLISPASVQNSIQPPISQNYGPPPQLIPPIQRVPSKPPQTHIGPPSVLGPPAYGPPKPFHIKGHPPRQNVFPVPNNFLNPPPNIYRPAKHQPSFIPPRFVPKSKPNHFGVNLVPFGMKPPLPDSYVTNYGVPPTSQVPFVSYGPPSSTYGAPLEGQSLPRPEPSDSYGAPVTGSNVQYALGVQTGKEYLPPPPQIGAVTPLIKLQEFDEILETPKLPELPLPLPNLNQYPMAPLRAPQNFLTEFHIDTQESRHNEVVNNGYHQNHQISNENIIGGNSILQNQFLNNDQKTLATQGYQQQNANHQNLPSVNDVQIVPSISLASYTSSVEYPINLIQSPIVDVTVSAREEKKEPAHSKEYGPPLKLSQNPIVVDTNYDNYPSSSNHNISYADFKRDNVKDAQSSFSNEVTEILPHPADVNQLATTGQIEPSTLSPVNYSNWSLVSTGYISTSMVPPTPGPSTWLTSTGAGQEIYTTTPRSKQIQIIIPYTKQSLKGRKVPPYNKEYESKLSLYTLPPTTESEWLKYSEAPTNKPEVINIKDFLKQNNENHHENSLPYDILSFQKNIDDWTALEYSKSNFHEFKKITTPSKVQSPKEIPKNFLITKGYNKPTTPKFFDHEPASSNQKENKVNTFNSLESNSIIEDTTIFATTTEEITTTTDLAETTNVIPTEETKVKWEETRPQKEKVYVVTPEPLMRSTTLQSTIAFSSPPKIGGKTAKHLDDGKLRLILSEWPHLINNLATTTNKPANQHPLLGLMGISSYVNPKNATIETYSGHSKVLLSNKRKQVITIVTPISVSRNGNLETTTENSRS